jgi:hypothetical protein
VIKILKKKAIKRQTQILAEICQNRTADKGRIFRGYLLLKSKSVQLMKVWIEPGAYAQEIAGPKDIRRIFMNFYGAAPKTVSGQQHPQILPHSN